jgi:valyl-tRNA synthetase
VDRWIYSRLNGAAKYITEAFLSYRFNDAAGKAYEYFWNDFCDWYVEATKLSMKGGVAGNGAAGDGDTGDGTGDAGVETEKDRAATVLLDVLAESLRLLHPLLPFVTEEIYGQLPPECKQDGSRKLPGTEQDGPSPGMLIGAAYPRYDEERRDSEGEERFAFLQDLVRRIRTLRSECTVTPDKRLDCGVRTGGEKRGEKAAFLRENTELVRLLAGLGNLTIEDAAGKAALEEKAGAAKAIVLAGQDYEARVYIAEAVDMKALAEKFRRNLERDRKYIVSLEAKIANPDFIKNAPPELIEGERQKLAEAKERTGTVEAYLKDMGQGE